MDSSQPPQANLALGSHPSNQNAPLCVSQALVSSAHKMIACLLHVYEILYQDYVELNQGALANIFQMSLPKAWLLFGGAEHQNFLETWRMNFCARLLLSTDLSTLVQALSVFV